MKLSKQNMILYAITDRSWLNGKTLSEEVEKAIIGGATFIQLREKNLNFGDFLNEAIEIRKICNKYKIPFVIDDNVEIAIKSGADGVHLGQNDMSIPQARRILGNNKIIGATARTAEQAIKAEQEGADYIGSGAVFATSTKSDTVPLSYENLCKICSSVSIPVVAIGGINIENVKSLKDSGISGVAVVSGIFKSDDVRKSAFNLKKTVLDILGE
ncbi:MAG: thiamine phosphate synthase [Oscillospiraceae bacterium]|nr:thiamine phosphate synthase [Oscillospiraceae bacterium]